MNTAKAKDLYDKIPKFSGQKDDVQLSFDRSKTLPTWSNGWTTKTVKMEPFVTSSENCLLEKQTKFGE